MAGGEKSIRTALLGVAIIVAVVLCLLVGNGSVGSIEPGEILRPGSAKGFNLVLITLDTTRADRLGCYGYARAKTPTLDALAARGICFDHAITTVPVTLPSHTTIMTGMYPFRHGVRNNGSYQVVQEHTTLAEMLKDAGYQTAAFVSAFVLDKRFGLDQGFDVYDFEISEEGRREPISLENERNAKLVTTAAIRWLDRQREKDKPFFLWVHYYDPHSPYESPASFIAPEAGESPLSVAYDNEIAFMDVHLKRLVEALENKKCSPDKTITLVVSDHGESLGEHEVLEHGGFIYEPCMHVAMILSGGGVPDRPCRVSDRVVSTADIVPTLMSLFGLPLKTELDGLDLLTVSRDTKRAVYMETLYGQQNMGCAPLFGLRRLKDKYIRAPRPEYYDLRKDPLELNNLHDKKYAVVKSLDQQLLNMMLGEKDDLDSKRVMTEEEMAKLKSLGYTDVSGDSVSLPDPKDHLPMMFELAPALRLMEQNKYAEALVIAEEVVDRLPGVEVPLLTTADILCKLNRTDDAINAMREFVSKYDSIAVCIALAQQLAEVSRYVEMETILRKAEELDSNCGMISVLRGDRLMAAGEYQQAAEQYHKGIELDGDRLGHVARNKLANAMKHCETPNQ